MESVLHLSFDVCQNFSKISFNFLPTRFTSFYQISYPGLSALTTVGAPAKALYAGDPQSCFHL